MFITFIVPVNAEDDFYHIYNFKDDGTREELDYFSSYSKAYSFFSKRIGEYDNVGIVYNDKIVELETGVASLRNDDCTENILYTDTKGKRGYINGCYVGDLAYIKTNRRAESVRLKVSGITADFDIDDVTLYPLNQLQTRLSSYTVIDDVLYHRIKTSITNDIFNAMLKLGKAPSYLDSGTYLSYDGHYFYNDYYTLIDDYRNNTYDNAINKDEPYYSYYMYLPQRTFTNYTVKEIDDYLKDTLLIESKIDYYYDLNRDSANDILNTSQLYGETEAFFANQYLFGANALMMLSLSFNESGYGRSRFAYNRNNLFGHSAYDNDIEKNASRYLTVASSIRSHAKYYISGSYGNADKYSYTGSFFGNKQSGMNVNYASDPYWGEKAAHYTYSIDEALGLKDYGSYRIGIVNECNKLKIYSDQELKKTSYIIDKYDEYALAILEEYDDVYKVALDKPNDPQNYTYDFETSVGYISKDDISYVTGDNNRKTDFVTVTYDFDGGLYNEMEELSVKTDKEHSDPLLYPLLTGFEFNEYQKEENDNSIKYKATYKEISSIETVNFDYEDVEINWYLDLRDVYLKVNYKGLGNKKIPITSDMISGFDLSALGSYEAEVSYCGLTVPVTIDVTSTDDFIRADIYEIIEKDNITLAEAYKVKELAKDIDGYYSMNQIRILDSLILNDQNNSIAYTIGRNDYNLGISGLALSVPFSNLSSTSNPFKETIEVRLTDTDKKTSELLSKSAIAYGYVPIDSFNIEITQNLSKAELVTPVVISVSHNDYDPTQIYMVYMVNEAGDLVKLNTSVSDGSIEFLTRETGSFVICYKKTDNTFIRPVRHENTNEENSVLSFAEYFLKISAGLAVAVVIGMAIIIILKKRKEYGRKTTKNHRRSRNLFKKKS